MVQFRMFKLYRKLIAHFIDYLVFKVIENWRNFPENVSIVNKASRYITHMKRLNDVEQGWESFME